MTDQQFESFNFDAAISHASALSLNLDRRRDDHAHYTPASNRLLTAVTLVEEAKIRLRRAQEISKEVPPSD